MGELFFDDENKNWNNPLTFWPIFFLDKNPVMQTIDKLAEKDRVKHILPDFIYDNKDEDKLAEKDRVKHILPDFIYDNKDEDKLADKIEFKKEPENKIQENFIETTSGIKVYNNYWDNLSEGIPQNDRDVEKKAKETYPEGFAKGLSRLGSENSEDAITLSFFKNFAEIPAKLWLPELLPGIKFTDKELKDINVNFFKEVKPPAERKIKEGNTECDLMIETGGNLIFCEIKYKSDISTGTKHDVDRNQIIRNIDVGSKLAIEKGKEFHMVFLGVDEKVNPAGYELIKSYKEHPELISRELPYRKDIEPGVISNNLHTLKWKDAQKLCAQLIENKNLDNNSRDLLEKLNNYLDRKDFNSSEEVKITDIFNETINQVKITGFEQCREIDNIKVKEFIENNIPETHLKDLKEIKYIDRENMGILGTWTIIPPHVIEIFKSNQVMNTITHEIGHNAHENLKKTDTTAYNEWKKLHNDSYNKVFDEEGFEKSQFVSEYAKNNHNEDFAESYMTYILTPAYLKEVSQDKYDFLKIKVFDGKEYTC